MDGQNIGGEKKSSGLVIGTVLALVVAIGAYGFFKYTKKEEISSETTITPSITTYLYKDGEYSAIGNYNSPGGAEEVGVKISLKDDVITSVKVDVLAERPGSVKMQTAFSSGISPVVVGKKLDEIVVDKVSGSSLTPKGFKDAIAKIKASAKA